MNVINLDKIMKKHNGMGWKEELRPSTGNIDINDIKHISYGVSKKNIFQLVFITNYVTHTIYFETQEELINALKDKDNWIDRNGRIIDVKCQLSTVKV